MNRPTLEDTWRARYDRWAGQHKSDHLIAGWSEQGLTRRMALVLRAIETTQLEKGSQILDLGAGPGTYMRALCERGYWCVGLDYSLNVVKIAKSKDRSGRYLQAEAYHLPFREAAFDALLCVGVLQSLQSIDLAIAEMRRVLMPGGYLLLDGLNSLFWLHGVRGINEALRGVEKRMSFYDPFVLAKKIERLGLCAPRIHWLAVPEAMQILSSGKRSSRSRLLSALFGHAFLIMARKQL
jgi:ubiquinone/menaquinone biosynthesis C-methylase UbiE